MPEKILSEIVIVFALSVGVIFLCHRVKIPAIVGFLLTGIVAGPHALGLIVSVHEVEILAEIGVVLLLFTIGIEFSLKNLLQIKRSVLLGGSLQVFLTIAVVCAAAAGLGLPFPHAVFFGFLISLSSTAIVLKLLQERGQIDTPHGRTDLGILIFQDIIIVPMILVTPLLAGEAYDLADFLLVLGAKGLGIIAVVVVSAKWVVPTVLFQVARTRSRELFLLSVVVICLAAAWLTAAAGLSLALGAFIAGLIISESEYNHQAIGNILPFRDVFTSFFFISVGMLLDVRYLAEHPGPIAALGSGVLVVKMAIAALVTLLMGLPLRTAVLVGFALCQVGEFSFILSKTGLAAGLMGDRYPLFLAASVVTMAASPFVLAAAAPVSRLLARLPLPRRLITGFGETAQQPVHEPLSDHLIIIGYGLNGQNLTFAAKMAGIPYIIVEMNPETVRRERAKGEPIVFGDAAYDPVLEHIHVGSARAAVVAINDPAATRSVVETIKRINPQIHLIARTRFLPEMKPLYDLGADEVIPEEFETSVEIFVRVMRRYAVARDEIERMVARVRSDGYEMLRSLPPDPAGACGFTVQLPDMEVRTYRVFPRSEAAGRTLIDLEIRRRHGVTVLAIRRGGEIITGPEGTADLREEDRVYLIGRPGDLVGAAVLFDPPEVVVPEELPAQT